MREGNPSPFQVLGIVVAAVFELGVLNALALYLGRRLETSLGPLVVPHLISIVLVGVALVFGFFRLYRRIKPLLEK
jgi:hypothetical protein